MHQESPDFGSSLGVELGQGNDLSAKTFQQVAFRTEAMSAMQNGKLGDARPGGHSLGNSATPVGAGGRAFDAKPM